MKWRIFFLAPLCFFVIPLCAHATTTTYFAQNNKEKIILTTIGATTTLTLELTGDTYSYDIRINDPKGKEVYSHPGVRGKTTTLTIPNLAPNTQYSLWLGAGGPYTFITTPGDPVVTNGNYTLRLVQYNGTVQAVYIVPKDDKSVFYLRFDKNGSQQLELAVSNGATSANSPTLTTYTYDLGDLTKRLGTGIYAVTLEGVNPKTTEKTDLVGPFYLSLFDTSLTYQWPLTITVDKKGGATLNGKVDFLKDFSASDYTVTIATNEGEPVFDGEGAPVAKPISLASDGSYSLVLSGLTPSGTYYFQQKVHSRVSSEDVRMGKFNADTGIVPMEGEVGYQKNFDSHSYRLLSPLPNLSFVFDPDLCRDYVAENKTLPPGTICDINQFINYIMKLLIGLAGVMLVLRIMFEGYQYLVTDVPALKSGAKNSIVESALGLVLALSAYLILNTINPQLVSNGVQLNDVAAGVEIVNLPDAGDGTIDSNFNGGKGTYSTDDTVSPEVIKVTEKLKAGWQIDYFKVYTNDRMLIAIKNGAQTDTSNVISISHGLNGFATPGTSKIGDRKTPVGIWKILDIRKPKGENQAVFNGNGSNMGAAFFHLSPMISGERGIGMHGNKRGTLGATYGCIRMKNADILALLPYIKTGTSVYIGK